MGKTIYFCEEFKDTDWGKGEPIRTKQYNCQGDLYYYENNVMVGIQRKNGKYIDKRVPPIDKDNK